MSKASTILFPLAPIEPPRSFPLRKWLWRVGGGVWLFVATLLAAGPFLSPEKEPAWRTFGHDCFISYAAGRLAGEGRWAELHDVNAFMRVQRELGEPWKIEVGDTPAPWLNPPFYALAWAPLAKLPYPAAWGIWLMFSLTALVVSCRLLTRMLAPALCSPLPSGEGRVKANGANATTSTFALTPALSRRERENSWEIGSPSNALLVFLLVTSSMPALLALGCGQNSCLSLLILTFAVTLWRAGRALPAGMVLGLMAYKPQLGAIVGLMLIASLGRRALLGLALTGLALLFATLLASPGSLTIYLEALPRTVSYMQENGHFPWTRHVTFHAFWHVLLAERIADGAAVARGLRWICQGTTIAALAWAAWRCCRAADDRSRDALIAATLAAMPLAMPYCLNYDLLMLAIPAALTARLLPAAPESIRRWLPRLWIALAAWQYFAMPLTTRLNFNATTPLLAALAAGLIAVAGRGVTPGKPE